ncbi:hypothetical protein EET67_11545 [Pseudaminobacter arsenicus]|uniref:DUF3426 domain-containing protein n=1 Tax=Borborobacter arsenicus TaxID=1851146 RepID=A0A432V693_9HYPH|nr:hypothetical protein [Pseudaminobacter arsenicus]RUM97692.1 hypothetical protein EET67_11545 [Pseudaminobacter arsenicus]
MADIRTARPVSGEIMTEAVFDAAPGRSLPGEDHDIVEADYETVLAPDGAPRHEHARSFAAARAPGGMDMLRHAIDADEPARGSPRAGPLFWVIGFVLAAAAIWTSGGHSLIRPAALPSLADAGPRISITGITSRIEETLTGPVLLVEAEAINGGSLPTMLPPLEIHVTGNEGKTTRYNLGTAAEPLAAGHRFAFSSRLDVPKNGVKMVSVTFGE